MDEVLKRERSIFDKSGIEFYNNENTKSAQVKTEGSSNETSPSFSYRDNGEIRQIGESIIERRTYSLAQNNFRSHTSPEWNYTSIYETSFNVYCFSL